MRAIWLFRNYFFHQWCMFFKFCNYFEMQFWCWFLLLYVKTLDNWLSYCFWLLLLYYHFCFAAHFIFEELFFLFIPACLLKAIAFAILSSYSYKRELLSCIVTKKRVRYFIFLITCKQITEITEKSFQRPLFEGV